MCKVYVCVAAELMCIYILTNTQAHTSAIIICFSHTATSLHWNRYIWFTILFICYQHFQVQTPNSFPICIVEDIYIYDSIVTSTCTCIFLPTCTCRFIAEVKVFLWFSFGSVGLYQKDSYCVMRQNNINSISSFIFSENVFSTYV